ncbi:MULTISPECIES: glycerophosphoryl diester phosphodiesterase membrane domain-containing protein [Streptomyces]|uniref:Glycerophosphoryl diester phosphodiesterase membrane domain-containing protein n=1 Tax=Streptomyces lycii TaxID=2654337 RepID=A0ABQ7FIF0_9ACTN|nr:MULTISPECIES: glycerophosphoryl diester phosphodiesterase membrane domain-containing protein [Streptomyces]KAF4408149.1 hypothetical protein GCU69_15785 [Streptomyces lycii]PGH50105.1 hypothetical protein CRI70_13950 [Streptomyces sp. Ru87]
MNNSPGWASPGSGPSDEPGQGTPPESDRPVPEDRDAPPVNWSKEQPPGGQWVTPAGQGPPPPPGGGPAPGPGGWQGGGPGWGWTQPPAVAKPGIIPLRPLGIGEILDGAVSTMRAHWRTVLGISLAVAVVTQAVSTAVTGLWFSDSAGITALENDPDPTVDEALDAVGGTLAGSGVTGVVGILGTIIATAMLTMVVSRAVIGRDVSAGEAWRDSRPQLLRLLGLLLLIPLLVLLVSAVLLAPGLAVVASGAAGAGAALTLVGGIAALVVAVWLWIRFSLAAPALMLERQGVIAAMRRSAKLVRGAWWRIFGIQILTTILIVFVAAVIEIPTSLIAMLVGGESAMDWLAGESAEAGWLFLVVIGIGAVISSTITFPISAGVTALLYMDQRIRREALDLELGRAAGVPGYGAPNASDGRPGDSAPGS